MKKNILITGIPRIGKSHFLPQLLHKIRKAQAYVKTPERFTRQGDRITLNSMHGVRTLTRDDQEWLCDCDFFVKHRVCSHALAVEDMF
jgi:nucleoside-triphosphatase THEP1